MIKARRVPTKPLLIQYSKVPSPVNLQNRFSSLMITEERSIENEPQVQTPTNYHQRIET